MRNPLQGVKAVVLSVIIIAPLGVENYRDVYDRNRERLEAWGTWHTRPQRVEQTQKQANVTEGALGFRV